MSTSAAILSKARPKFHDYVILRREASLFYSIPFSQKQEETEGDKENDKNDGEWRIKMGQKK